MMGNIISFSTVLGKSEKETMLEQDERRRDSSLRDEQDKIKTMHPRLNIVFWFFGIFFSCFL